ncbi:MAG: hypothetical protein DHS20C21_12800 [Gemmatimonadota bacterium]|nr:MAG: hypothetical protein DHS20C21_12800 [Gemmatimonadota bacterium]
MQDRYRRPLFLALLCAAASTGGCGTEVDVRDRDAGSATTKQIVSGLPTVGVLLYDKVLTTEVTAPVDVFTKHPDDSPPLFNVITLAASTDPVVTEEGLAIVPDYTFATSPKLDVLVIPSAYDMAAQVSNETLVQFIRDQNRTTAYTMSNCAGAQLVGESGIADGKRIVTWIGGGEDLQKTYPNLSVSDDALVTFERDGKFFSSNGNLASYISALELLEEMTSREHRQFVESYLYLGRLRDWAPSP